MRTVTTDCPCWSPGDGGQCGTCGEVADHPGRPSSYAQDYERGWRYAHRFDTLDRADRDGRSSNDAWLDGYLDHAAGREKWHRRDCPNHEECP